MGSILHTPEGTRRKAGSSWGCPYWGPQRNFHRQPLTQLVSTTEYLLCDRVVFISLIPITKHLANLNKGKVCFGTQFNGTICTVGKSRWQKCGAVGHFTPTVRKQTAMDAGTRLDFSFYSGWDPSPWNGTTHLQPNLETPSQVRT